jgi:ubiquinone/menaquinone biosynthesis C-methylase UbiE
MSIGGFAEPQEKMMQFICCECGGKLEENESLNCPNGHKFKITNGIYNLLPANANATTEAEAVYHDSVKEEWVELNQINTLRNLHYHEQIIKFIKEKSSPESTILELGGGVGFDLQLFINSAPDFKEYIFSEIHQNMTLFCKEHIRNDKVTFCNIDVLSLPLQNNSIDIVYMIAALHHFPDMESTFSRIRGIVKPNGYIICGIEPNRSMLALLKTLSGIFRKKITSGAHSAADEDAEGFTEADFEKFASRNNLKIVRLERIWFLCGFAHYGLEFIYRALKLKKRLRLPHFAERILIIIDKFLLKLPVCKRFSWHYSVYFQKNS